MGTYNSKRFPYQFTFDPAKPKDLAYIVGVILGDGSLSNNLVELSSIDREFVEYFADKLGNVFGRRPKVHITRDAERKFVMGTLSNCKAQYKCRLSCKNIALFLRERIGDLSWIKTKEEKTNFIKGLWDSDGSIDKKKYHLRFCNTDKKLLSLFRDLCKELGLCAYISDNIHVSIRRKNHIAQLYRLMNGATIERKNDIFIQKFGEI